MSNRFSTQLRITVQHYLKDEDILGVARDPDGEETIVITCDPDTRVGTLDISRYPNGEVALIICGQTQYDELVVTVALQDAPRIGPRFVWLKGWSENEGVPDALVRAGFVRLSGEVFQTGFVDAQKAELIGALQSEVMKHFSEPASD